MKSTPLLTQPLCFEPVALSQRERYLSIAMQNPLQSAERGFATLYLWSATYGQKLAFTGDHAVIRFGKDGNYKYMFPVGAPSPRPIIDALLQAQAPLRLVSVNERELSWLLDAYPDTFDVREVRDYEDYLYSAESLDTLAGKKLHAKRNHINAFCAAHEWSVRSLTPADFDDCRAILDAWCAERPSDSVQHERRAIDRAFHAFSELELHGALLVADGQSVAFTIGSMITPDTLDVHFEKALPLVSGAYPTINREFVRMMRRRFPTLAWVNREEDMGIENLRKAKLSYHPAALIKKFSLTQKIK